MNASIARQSLGAGLGVALLLLTVGFVLPQCSRLPANRLGLVPVEGVVTVDGQPLAGAQVEFYPGIREIPAPGPVEISEAVTDAAGRYTLHGAHGVPGAMVAVHYVVIRKQVLRDGSAVPTGVDLAALGPHVRQLLTPEYTDRQRTVLSVRVHPGGSRIDFRLPHQALAD